MASMARPGFSVYFTETVPNFDGLSRKNYVVSRDAELSQIPNPVPILSRSECNVMLHVDKVYTYRPKYLYRIRCCQMRSFELKSIFGPVAVLHICIWGGSRGGVGCARGGTKSFHMYRV